MPLQISILYICTKIKSVYDNQEFYFNDEENRLRLKNTLSQKI